jgi:hypothetical protein
MPVLLNSVKTQIVNCIQLNGLNPLDFKRNQYKDSYVLAYKDSNLWFQISLDESRMKHEFIAFPSLQRQTITLMNGSTIMPSFESWVKDSIAVYQREQDIGDPFVALEQKHFIQQPGVFDQNKFNSDEVKAIEPAINDLDIKLDGIQSLTDEIKEFRRELNEMKEELKNSKKKDWRMKMAGWSIQLFTLFQEHAPEHLDNIKSIVQEFFDQFNRPLIS